MPPTNLLPLTPARLVTLHLQGICIITWNNNSTCRRKWFQTPIHPAVNPLPCQDFSLKNCFDGITMEKQFAVSISLMETSYCFIFLSLNKYSIWDFFSFNDTSNSFKMEIPFILKWTLIFFDRNFLIWIFFLWSPFNWDPFASPSLKLAFRINSRRFNLLQSRNWIYIQELIKKNLIEYYLKG